MNRPILISRLTRFANDQWTASKKITHSHMGVWDEYPCANPEGAVDNSDWSQSLSEYIYKQISEQSDLNNGFNALQLNNISCVDIMCKIDYQLVGTDKENKEQRLALFRMLTTIGGYSHTVQSWAREDGTTSYFISRPLLF